MILTWFLYTGLSIFIGFLLSMLVKNKFFQIFLFSLYVSLTITPWFKIPGESFFAPIFTIFFLESTILEKNGLERILRPLFISFIFTYLVSFIFWKKKTRN